MSTIFHGSNNIPGDNITIRRTIERNNILKSKFSMDPLGPYSYFSFLLMSAGFFVTGVRSVHCIRGVPRKEFDGNNLF